MNMATIEKKSVKSAEGFPIEIGNCGHCGAFPTDADIEKALKEMGKFRVECAICKQKLKWVSAKIQHHLNNGRDHDWGAYGDLEPFFRIRTIVQSPQVQGFNEVEMEVHVSCLASVIPNFKKYTR